MPNQINASSEHHRNWNCAQQKSTAVESAPSEKKFHQGNFCTYGSWLFREWRTNTKDDLPLSSLHIIPQPYVPDISAVNMFCSTTDVTATQIDWTNFFVIQTHVDCDIDIRKRFNSHAYRVCLQLSFNNASLVLTFKITKNSNQKSNSSAYMFPFCTQRTDTIFGLLDGC